MHVLKQAGCCLALLAWSACSDPMPETASTWVPASFSVPERLDAETYRLVKLTPALAALDYEAVMETRAHLRERFGGEWPGEAFTLEENTRDLDEHERLFDERTSFTYSVLSPDGGRVLGCIYINPADDADAQVHLWVRESERASGLEPRLVDALRGWLTRDWPFETVAFPLHDAE
ncbi:MAG: hypothetical protein R2834_23270 [Rhodothermales bacterium]